MAERVGKLPTTPIRYAYVAPDGTIPYFEASDGRQVSGRLPAGADPMQLKEHGYEFVSRDIFTQTQKATDPQYRAEQEGADDLAEAFDMNNGTDDDTLAVLLANAEKQQSGARAMNGANGSQLNPEMMQVLEGMMQDGSLANLFQPFEQQQQLIQQASQTGRHASPTGAMLGGLAKAIGTGGQAFLNNKMQGDASNRLTSFLKSAQAKRGINPTTGLMDTAVDDAELAALMAGG